MVPGSGGCPGRGGGTAQARGLAQAQTPPAAVGGAWGRRAAAVRT